MTPDQLQTAYALAMLGACMMVLAFFAWRNK